MEDALTSVFVTVFLANDIKTKAYAVDSGKVKNRRAFTDNPFMKKFRFITSRCLLIFRRF